MKKILAAALALATLLCAGCAADEQSNSTLFAMDTVMEFAVYGENAEEGIEAAEEEILRIENLMSAERVGSDIYAVNEGAGGAVAVSQETAKIIKFACDVHANTEGAFDISVYPAVRAWGFVSGEDYRVPDDAELAELADAIGSEKIDISGNSVALPNGGSITLGAIAKGYAGTRAAQKLRDAGVEHALLTLGGNVVCVGTKPDGTPWKIGIASPDDPAGYFGVVECADESVVTSGGYQRNFEADGKTYHHIIDPATLKPAQSDLISVTVIAEDGALADALSTAIYVMGSEKGIWLWQSCSNFELVLMKQDGSVIATEGAGFSPQSGVQTEYIKSDQSINKTVFP